MNKLDYLMKAFYTLGVEVFKVLAEYLGVSYMALNITVFCIIGPAIFLVMAGIIIHMHYKLKYLKS